MGINFIQENTPDAITLLHFRRMLKDNGLGAAMFEAINKALESAG
jgi:IS5 family transposase